MKQKLKRQQWKKDIKHIHVNQAIIRTCNTIRKKAIDGEIDKVEAESQMPDAMTMKYNGTNTYASTFIMYHPETGEEVGRFDHSPFDPFSCGAQLVFTTDMYVLPVPRIMSEDVTDLKKQYDVLLDMHESIEEISNTARIARSNIMKEMHRIMSQLMHIAVKSEIQAEGK